MNSASASPIRAQSFAEILDDLADANDIEARPGVRYFSDTTGHDWLFSLLKATIDKEPDPPSFDAAFFAEADETLEDRASDPFVPCFDLDEDKIAADLDLAAVRTVADLARARRAFALRNHPDLFHQSVRDQATARMQLANMLLDRRRKEIEAGR